MNINEAKELLKEVQDNHKKLADCPLPHDFSIDLDPTRNWSKRFKCTKCGGYVYQDKLIWYEKGLADAKKVS